MPLRGVGGGASCTLLLGHFTVYAESAGFQDIEPVLHDLDPPVDLLPQRKPWPRPESFQWGRVPARASYRAKTRMAVRSISVLASFTDWRSRGDSVLWAPSPPFWCLSTFHRGGSAESDSTSRTHMSCTTKIVGPAGRLERQHPRSETRGSVSALLSIFRQSSTSRSLLVMLFVRNAPRPGDISNWCTARRYWSKVTCVRATRPIRRQRASSGPSPSSLPTSWTLRGWLPGRPVLARFRGHVVSTLVSQGPEDSQEAASPSGKTASDLRSLSVGLTVSWSRT